MKKKVIVSMSKAGSVGKSLISGLFVDQARNRLNIRMATYLCDLTKGNTSLLNTCGIKTAVGNLVSASEQNPIDGVYCLDLFSQLMENVQDEKDKEIYNNKIAKQFQESLNSDADIIFYDMPATNLDSITGSAFGNIEKLIDGLEFNDTELYFLMPYANEKSIESIADVFNKTKHRNVNYIVVINKKLLDVANNYTVESYYNSAIFNQLRRSNYKELMLPVLSEHTIKVIEKTKLSSFYNYDALNDSSISLINKTFVKSHNQAMAINQDLLNLMKFRHTDSNGMTLETGILNRICEIIGE